MEIAREADPGFKQFKTRPEFKPEVGGDGELCDRAEDDTGGDSGNVSIDDQPEQSEEQRLGSVFSALDEAIKPAVRRKPIGS